MIDGLKSKWGISGCTLTITNNLNAFVFLIIDAGHVFLFFFSISFDGIVDFEGVVIFCLHVKSVIHFK